MHGRYPPRWKFDGDRNTVYVDALVTDSDTVHRMRHLANQFFNGHHTVQFYWGVGMRDNAVRRNVEVRGIRLQISILESGNCAIMILGKPDVMGVATGPMIWNNNLGKQDFSALLDIAQVALLDHLRKEEED